MCVVGGGGGEIKLLGVCCTYYVPRACTNASKKCGASESFDTCRTPHHFSGNRVSVVVVLWNKVTLCSCASCLGICDE